MELSDQELFRHELCTNFGNEYEMSKEEANRFAKTFSYIHALMTNNNGATLHNLLWLQDNYFELHNKLSIEEMVKKCIEHSIEYLTIVAIPKQPASEDIINTEKKGLK